MLKFQIGKERPLGPDRRAALSYFGGEAASPRSERDRAARPACPFAKNRVKRHPPSGGGGTILVVVFVAWYWPEIRKYGKLA